MATLRRNHCEARGRDAGIEIGRRAALSHCLEQMLTARFGALPPALTQRIASAATHELDSWIVRAATAASLQAFSAGLAPT